ncbi:MAG: GntR family transcriptional regulator [Anaerolineae bacterium]|nr:GntR family transcriptional regulator [Anaerolineae bacterium]
MNPAEPKLNTAVYIHRRLREAIIEGQLQSGSAIRQDEIAARYGVSKIPVREALVLLEAEGFVTSQPGRGASVTELSAAEVEEIYLMRLGLETILLERSLPNLTPLDFARTEGILHALDSDNLDPLAWQQLDREFHSGLYRGANLPRIQATVANLHGNLARYYTVYQSFGETFRVQGQQEHRAILDACRRQENAEACDLLRHHLTRSSSTLIEQLTK